MLSRMASLNALLVHSGISGVDLGACGGDGGACGGFGGAVCASGGVCNGWWWSSFPLRLIEKEM